MELYRRINSNTLFKFLRDHPEKLMVTFLVLLIAAPYMQVYSHQFVNWDDPDYITRNRMVASGLSWSGITWAFTSIHAANWHPLTWISLMLDVTLFGTSPRATHLINVALHVCNSALVFILFKRLGASPSSALLMASFFGVHPVRVESVAWAAERKDVLCAFFYLAAWISYLRYVQRCDYRSYAGTTMFFMLALLSKPMAVTWPIVALIHDFWPDKRLESVRRRITEKIPWIILSAMVAVVTLLVQEKGNAVKSLEVFSVAGRIANAGMSYLTYLGQTLWPVELTVFYPYTGETGLWFASAAWTLLILITLCVIWQKSKMPYLLYGWGFFLIALLPVIGIIQVGLQAHADRYMYLPQIGLILAGGLCLDLSVKAKGPRLLAGGAAGLVVCVLCGLTWRQVGYWENTVTLFTQNLKVAGENDQAHFNLGTEYSERQLPEKAIYHFLKAKKIHPEDADINNNLGNALQQVRRYDEAAAVYRNALYAKPDNPVIIYNLGNCYVEMKRLEQAEECYRKAILQDPFFANAYYRLGEVKSTKGDFEAAVIQYNEVIRLEPGWTEAVQLRDRAWQMAREKHGAGKR